MHDRLIEEHGVEDRLTYMWDSCDAAHQDAIHQILDRGYPVDADRRKMIWRIMQSECELRQEERIKAHEEEELQRHRNKVNLEIRQLLIGDRPTQVSDEDYQVILQEVDTKRKLLSDLEAEFEQREASREASRQQRRIIDRWVGDSDVELSDSDVYLTEGDEIDEDDIEEEKEEKKRQEEYRKKIEAEVERRKQGEAGDPSLNQLVYAWGMMGKMERKAFVELKEDARQDFLWMHPARRYQMVKRRDRYERVYHNVAKEHCIARRTFKDLIEHSPSNLLEDWIEKISLELARRKKVPAHDCSKQKCLRSYFALSKQ